MKGYKYELAVWITAEDEHEAEEKLFDALEPENEVIWWECVCPLTTPTNWTQNRKVGEANGQGEGYQRVGMLYKRK